MRGNLVREIARIEVQRVVHFGQNRHGARRDHGRRSGHESVRRNDHLVPGAGIDAKHRCDKRCRPPVHREGVPATQPFAIPGLHLRGFRLLRASGQKPEQTLLLQDVQNSGILPLIDQSRSMETGAQAFRAHWFPAIDR